MWCLIPYNNIKVCLISLQIIVVTSVFVDCVVGGAVGSGVVSGDGGVLGGGVDGAVGGSSVIGGGGVVGGGGGGGGGVMMVSGGQVEPLV